MYNRYIPQSDGSYSRKSVQSAQQPAPIQEAVTQPLPDPLPASSTQQKHAPVPGFLRQLLPKEFDTGDLLIILLLLLMAGDCEEEKSNALLTLALYFFI